MEIIYTDGMITINETMVVVLLSFLVFVFIINRLMFRPLAETIKARQDHIAGLETAVTDMKAEAARMTEELQKQEAAAKDEARQMRKKLEAAGSDQANQIFQESRQEISRIKTTAQEEVNQQVVQARQQIQQETDRLATTIMEQILGRGSISG